MSEIVNDRHSKLNQTSVRKRVRPSSLAELQTIVRSVQNGESLVVCGERHAMGGQQFCADATLVDTTALNRILALDETTGQITVEAGICWPELIDGYLEMQAAHGNPRWGIAQKQTGADNLTIGGAVSANAHGRGLLMAPIVSDVAKLQVVTADGTVMECSRTKNQELFRHVVGGYGLFGIIYSVTLQLIPRQVLRRTVRVMDIEDAVPAAVRRIQEGYLFGDFQFDIDPESPDFLTKGVFSGYQPTSDGVLPPKNLKELRDDDWRELLFLAHAKKAAAFTQYAQHYIATDGQLYYSDLHQLSTYLDDYHTALDKRLGATCGGSEMITELYVEPEHLISFLRLCARKLVARKSQVIYGTIRLINPDTETALPWAKKRWTCVIFNLHVDHTPAGIVQARDAFRDLIDAALKFDGCFFLTYHRFATRDQLLKAYPELPAFLAFKKAADPQTIFRSTWFDWVVATMQGGTLDHHAPQ